MQVQKDDVRNKIIAAATEEFLNAGYQQSSMRNIAAQAGITVGNVYAYFGGKDALFESIISPVWQSLNRLISIPGGHPGPDDSPHHQPDHRSDY